MSGANPIRGEVQVTVGETSFTLVPSFARLAKLEAALGRSLVQFSLELGTGRVSFQDVALILDQLAKSPKPTMDAIGSLVVEDGIMVVVPKLAPILERVLTGSPEENPSTGSEEGA